MKNTVVVVDTSGSMMSYLREIKEFLPSFFAFLMNLGYQVALVSFSNEVHIRSYYTTDLVQLQNQVSGLSPGGLTALYDAILVGLVFEDPHPDLLVVFSDGGENRSDSGEDNWKTKASELGINVYPYPLDGFQDNRVLPLAPVFTKKVISIPEAAKKWQDIAGRVKAVKIIKKPEDLLSIEPLKR